MMTQFTEKKWTNSSYGVKKNNLSLNVNKKKKKITFDIRRNHMAHTPLTIQGNTVESMRSTKFLGLHITNDLSWTTNTTSLVKRAQQCLYFLWWLKRANLPLLTSQLSTKELERASLPAVSQSGMVASLPQTRNPSRESWGQKRKSLEHHARLYSIFTGHMILAEPLRRSWTLPTLHMDCSYF